MLDGDDVMQGYEKYGDGITACFFFSGIESYVIVLLLVTERGTGDTVAATELRCRACTEVPSLSKRRDDGAMR